jgi:hypothetical protein
MYYINTKKMKIKKKMLYLDKKIKKEASYGIQG